MPGGRRPGAGRKREAKGGRAWARTVADNYRERAIRALEVLETLDPDKFLARYFAFYEHGYGRPPQALDISSDQPIQFVAHFADGAPVSAPAEAVPEGAGR